MHALLRKAAAIGFLMFLALWIVGAARGLSLPTPRPTLAELSLASLREESSRLASANNLRQIGLAQASLPMVLDQGDIDRIQVYERSGLIATGTAAFDDDLALLRAALAAEQATIFTERSGGI